MMQSLELYCEGGHTHEPFNISRNSGVWTFDTSKEAEYPTILCQRVAELVVSALIARGWLPLAKSLADADEHFDTKRQRKRSSMGLFVRGNRLPPVISEFLEVRELENVLQQPGSVFTLQDLSLIHI